MTTHAVHDADGILVSVGTILADPMPDGLTALALSEEDADRLARLGWGWDPTTLTVSVEPPAPEPDPLTALQAQVVELTAALEALLGGDA